LLRVPFYQGLGVAWLAATVTRNVDDNFGKFSCRYEYGGRFKPSGTVPFLTK
jgi:hypothetical protein